MSDSDSSQRPHSNCEANVIEYNINNSTSLIKNTLSPSNSNESFKQFKTNLLGNVISFRLPHPFLQFKEGTVIELKNNGYLLNKTIYKDLTIEQAHAVWDYMYENRNKLYKMIEDK